MLALADQGLLVVDVQAGSNPAGNHPSAKQPRCAAAATAHQATIEDQRNVVWAADIEVVADDLFET